MLASILQSFLRVPINRSLSFNIYQQNNIRIASAFRTFANKINDDAPLTLNSLTNVPGSRKPRKRVGRGIGSGLGKTAGKGHKGQNARGKKVRPGFEGGQTPLFRRIPKVGFSNKKHAQELSIVNLGKLQLWIDMGRLKIPEEGLISIKTLKDCGLLKNVKDGVKLLSKSKEIFNSKINIEVSRASKSAVETVEKFGGTVTCTHFTRLSLRALLKPEKFDLLPRRPQPPPRLMSFYLDYQNRGYLSPEIQLRNKQLNLTSYPQERLKAKREATA